LDFFASKAIWQLGGCNEIHNRRAGGVQLVDDAHRQRVVPDYDGVPAFFVRPPGTGRPETGDA